MAQNKYTINNHVFHWRYRSKITPEPNGLRSKVGECTLLSMKNDGCDAEPDSGSRISQKPREGGKRHGKAVLQTILRHFVKLCSHLLAQIGKTISILDLFNWGTILLLGHCLF